MKVRHRGEQAAAGFLAALGFLTRLPAGRARAASPAEFRAAMVAGLPFFPLVGALAGLLSALVYLFAAQVFPPHLAALLALLAEVFLTGALHEDAVADFCDAFGSARPREETLRILQDSRIGSFGALGVLFAVALRAGGLAALADPAAVAVALAVSGAAGRLAVLALMAAIPPAPGRDGLASRAGEAATWRTVLLGALFAAPVFVWGLAASAGAVLMGFVLSAAFAVVFRRLVLRRLGGVTGDGLGFAAYVTIVLVTLSFAAGSRG